MTGRGDGELAGRQGNVGFQAEAKACSGPLRALPGASWTRAYAPFIMTKCPEKRQGCHRPEQGTAHPDAAEGVVGAGFNHGDVGAVPQASRFRVLGEREVNQRLIGQSRQTRHTASANSGLPSPITAAYTYDRTSHDSGSFRCGQPRGVRNATVGAKRPGGSSTRQPSPLRLR